MNSYSFSVQDFLSHCEVEKKLSPKTLKAYRTDLHQLDSYLLSIKHSMNVKDISKVELRQYLIHISKLKPKSIKRKVASIKTLFNYLEFDDHITVNPLRKMRINIKEEKVLPQIMDIEEIFKIFKIAYKDVTNSKSIFSYFESIRNVVIIELLFATGIRVSELVSLKRNRIDLTTGNVVIKGKGNKERIIQICNQETISALKIYYAVASDKISKADDYFLINRFSTAMSDQSVRKIVKHFASKAGITKKITPHTFRHSFATLLLEKDVDIKYIQSFLGHSSIITTQIYTQVNRKKQAEILVNKHPRTDFKMIVN